MIISEASRRACSTRSQQVAKPGRQLITFLLFANITLWILDTFMTHNWITQEMQLSFYGLLAWGIISRISLPLLIFYRFDDKSFDKYCHLCFSSFSIFKVFQGIRFREIGL